MDAKGLNADGSRIGTKDRLSPELSGSQGERLYNFLQASPIPTFAIDSDHRVIYWSRALEELSHISAAEVLGTRQHWRAFYAEKRPCMADLLVAEAFEGIDKWYAGKYRKSDLIQDAFEGVDFFPTLGDTGKWLRFTAAAVWDDSGVMAGAVETLEDVSDNIRAETDLLESEHKLQSVIQRFPIPVFLINRDHEVTHWNLALQKLSGIKAVEMIGSKNHWRAFYKNERPCLADLLVDGSVGEIETWYSGKAAKSSLIDEAFEGIDFFPDLGPSGKWIRFIAATFKNSQGSLIGAIQTLDDITDKINAERALHAAHTELEVRVEERTKELIESSRALKEEVIERRLAEGLLKKQERQLKIKSENLENTNTALKVMLRQREEDKKDSEEKILTNVKEVILPYIHKLKKTPLNEQQLANLNEIETNLNNIISPFVKNLTTKFLSLTPREIQIAILVKEGKTTKEISGLLNTSTAAVDFHRNNIRIKLGLKNKKANLRARLMSFKS